MAKPTKFTNGRGQNSARNSQRQSGRGQSAEFVKMLIAPGPREQKTRRLPARGDAQGNIRPASSRRSLTITHFEEAPENKLPDSKYLGAAQQWRPVGACLCHSRPRCSTWPKKSFQRAVRRQATEVQRQPSDPSDNVISKGGFLRGAFSFDSASLAAKPFTNERGPSFLRPITAYGQLTPMRVPS